MKIHWFIKVMAAALITATIGWGAYTNEQITAIKEVNATQTATQVDILNTLNRIDGTLIRMDERDRSRPTIRVIYKTPPRTTEPHYQSWWEQP